MTFLNLKLPLAPQIAAIPAIMTLLDLTGNELWRLKGAELATALAAIPATVRSLDLTYNDLGRKSSKALKRILAAIPASVTALTFRMNDLGHLKTAAQLAEIVAAIPATITSLDLGWNDLWKKTGAELAQILRAIPVTVLRIALNGNDLNRKSIDDLKALLSTGKNIILEESITALLQRIQKNEQQRIALLAGYLPNPGKPKITQSLDLEKSEWKQKCAFFQVFQDPIADKQVLRTVFQFLG